MPVLLSAAKERVQESKRTLQEMEWQQIQPFRHKSLSIWWGCLLGDGEEVQPRSLLSAV